MGKRRLLFVVPSLRRAGAETQIVQLVNGLSGNEFERNLVCYLEDDDLRDELQLDSKNVFHFRRTRKVDLNVAKKIASIIDDQKIEIVHCTLENALLYGAMAVHFSIRKPHLLCAVHTTRHPSWKHTLADVLVYRHLLKRCDQVWFMSQTQAEIWVERMPFLRQRHRVIYNGIDCDKFDPDLFVQTGLDYRKKLGISNEASVICCIAGLRPEKLHLVLLHSFRKISKVSGTECYLLLAGTGPMESELRNLTQELDLGDQVRFLGGLADVRPLLAASDCKVLCSAAETFSMAMLEAMAMRVPVLATKVGGSGDAITDGQTGILITPGNSDELAEKLMALLSDRIALANMGRLAREVVIGRFSDRDMIINSARNLAELSAIS